MSTIAFDGKTVAFDTQHGSTYRIGREPWMKMRPVDNPVYQLAGGTGISQAVEVFIKWVRDGSDESKFPEFCKEHGASSNYIAITHDGYWVEFEFTSIPVTRTNKKDSAGSGSDYALGAMLAGATAEEAVNIAASLDPGTGGEIFVHAVVEGAWAKAAR